MSGYVIEEGHLPGWARIACGPLSAELPPEALKTLSRLCREEEWDTLVIGGIVITVAELDEMIEVAKPKPATVPAGSGG